MGDAQVFYPEVIINRNRVSQASNATELSSLYGHHDRDKDTKKDVDRGS